MGSLAGDMETSCDPPPYLVQPTFSNRRFSYMITQSVTIDWNCATRPGTQAGRSRPSRNSPIGDGSGSRGGPGVHRKTRAHTFLSWSVLRGRGHSAADDRGTSSGRVRLLQRHTARAINGGEL